MDVKCGVSLFSLIFVAFFPPSLYSDTNTNNSHFASRANAKAAAVQKAAYAPPGEVASTAPNSAGSAASELTTLLFTAPPRETVADGKKMYEPIAAFLTRAIGKKFEYRHPGNWLTYTDQMRAGRYDLIFDGPHFVGWRSLHINHVPLLKLPQPHVWAVVVRADNQKTNKIADLAGRKICAHSPPNFGTLTLPSLFNPLRQPYLVTIKGWRNAFEGVDSGKCEGTILPFTNLKKFDPDSKIVKVIHKHKPYPNQAFTASPRISPEMRQQIVTALSSPEGKTATKSLRGRFAKGADLVTASTEEYADVALVLRTVWGFEF